MQQVKCRRISHSAQLWMCWSSLRPPPPASLCAFCSQSRAGMQILPLPQSTCLRLLTPAARLWDQTQFGWATKMGLALRGFVSYAVYKPRVRLCACKYGFQTWRARTGEGHCYPERFLVRLSASVGSLNFWAQVT